MKRFSRNLSERCRVLSVKNLFIFSLKVYFSYNFYIYPWYIYPRIITPLETLRTHSLPIIFSYAVCGKSFGRLKNFKPSGSLEQPKLTQRNVLLSKSSQKICYICEIWNTPTRTPTYKNLVLILKLFCSNQLCFWVRCRNCK